MELGGGRRSWAAIRHGFMANVLMDVGHGGNHIPRGPTLLGCLVGWVGGLGGGMGVFVHFGLVLMGGGTERERCGFGFQVVEGWGCKAVCVDGCVDGYMQVCRDVTVECVW